MGWGLASSSVKHVKRFWPPLHKEAPHEGSNIRFYSCIGASIHAYIYLHTCRFMYISLTCRHTIIAYVMPKDRLGRKYNYINIRERCCIALLFKKHFDPHACHTHPIINECTPIPSKGSDNICSWRNIT